MYYSDESDINRETVVELVILGEKITFWLFLDLCWFHTVYLVEGVIIFLTLYITFVQIRIKIKTPIIIFIENQNVIQSLINLNCSSI